MVVLVGLMCLLIEQKILILVVPIAISYEQQEQIPHILVLLHTFSQMQLMQSSLLGGFEIRVLLYTIFLLALKLSIALMA